MFIYVFIPFFYLMTSVVEFESGAIVPVTIGAGGRRFVISPLVSSEGLRTYDVEGSSDPFYKFNPLESKFDRFGIWEALPSSP